MEKRQEYFNRVVKWAYNPKDRGPDPLRILFFINPILILIIVTISNGIGPHFGEHYFYGLLVGEGVSLTCFLSSFTLSHVGLRILKIEVQPKSFFMVNAAAMVPGIWVGFFIADTVFRESRPTHNYSDYSSGLVIGALFLCLYSLMDMWLTAQKHAKTLENENLQAKLSALSAQLNPHLLFNALNTIASTIPSNPQAAEETTLKLSDRYRGILTSSKRTSHTLSEELEICRAYLGIESSRFGERLKWSIEVEPGLENMEIPTLLIQPLVENAIKHGISQNAKGGSLEVRISGQLKFANITIEDDGVGFGNSRQSAGTGTGVSSCRSRLELFYRGQATFDIRRRPDDTGTRIQICIPQNRESVT